MNKVLFLCSGNYYRSRFAEIYFNYLNSVEDIGCKAFSRGLRVRPETNNYGAISVHTIDKLKELNLLTNSPFRFPLQAKEIDFKVSDVIVAVKEQEHRTMMEEKFPQFIEQTIFWKIDDLDFATPAIALPVLQKATKDLFLSLKS